MLTGARPTSTSLTAYTTDGDVVLSGGARRIDITGQDGDVVAPQTDLGDRVIRRGVRRR